MLPRAGWLVLETQRSDKVYCSVWLSLLDFGGSTRGRRCPVPGIPGLFSCGTINSKHNPQHAESKPEQIEVENVQQEAKPEAVFAKTLKARRLRVWRITGSEVPAAGCVTSRFVDILPVFCQPRSGERRCREAIGPPRLFIWQGRWRQNSLATWHVCYQNRGPMHKQQPVDRSKYNGCKNNLMSYVGSPCRHQRTQRYTLRVTCHRFPVLLLDE